VQLFNKDFRHPLYPLSYNLSASFAFLSSQIPSLFAYLPPRLPAYLYLLVYITCFIFLTFVINLFIKNPAKLKEKVLGSIKSGDIFTQNCLPSSISKDHLTGALSRMGKGGAGAGHLAIFV